MMLAIIHFLDTVCNGFRLRLGRVLKTKVDIDGRQRFMPNSLPKIPCVKIGNPSAHKNQVRHEIAEVIEDLEQKLKLFGLLRQVDPLFLLESAPNIRHVHALVPENDRDPGKAVNWKQPDTL